MGATAERMRMAKKKKRRGSSLSSQFSGGFTPLRHDLANSSEVDSLSGSALKILIALMGKLNGENNGNLSLTYEEAFTRFGFSKTTTSKSLKELEEKGFIIKTRLGYKSVSNLYAVTFVKLSKVEHINQSATARPSDDWKGKMSAASL